MPGALIWGPMRDVWLRAALAALAMGLPSTAAPLVAAGCGEQGAATTGNGSDSSVSSEAGGPDSEGPDSTTRGDSSAFDSAATDSTPGDSAVPDAGSQDASFDSPFDFDAGDCGTGPMGEPVDLSCTGLYSDFASKTVAADVTEYDPGLRLWSDGASKTRWIYLPPGQKIDTSDMDEWTFPVGTRIRKEFRLVLGDASTETRIETRLLWKLTPTFWYRTTYRWSPDGTTGATELTTGQTDAGNGNYEIPGQFECNTCHDGRRDGVLGFEAVSLSSPAAAGLPMQALITNGLITDAPKTALVVPGDATEAAALGWLHANCGVPCHNDGNGNARFSGFIMRLDVATLGSVQATNTYATGWNQRTMSYVIPGVSTSYRLHACDTAESCAYYRASHRDGVGGALFGTQMPPIDSHAVDAVDVAAIAAWINEGCDAGAADQ